MSDDRTKPPPGYILQERGWSTPHRPRFYAEVDAYEGREDETIADCWAHHDDIAARAEARALRWVLGLLEKDAGCTIDEDGATSKIWRYTAGDVAVMVRARLKEVDHAQDPT